MASIIIAGNAAVITSAFTTAQLEKLKKYAPEALVLKDEDKKPVFMVDVATKGSIGPMGVVFNATAYDGSEKAVLSKEIPAGVTDIERWVIDNIGNAIVKLNELEATLDGAIATVDANEAAILDSIAIVGTADIQDAEEYAPDQEWHGEA